MSEIRDFSPSSRKLGTFSYLKEMEPERIRKQVEYIVRRGWNPAVEHSEPENAFDHYWYMWKLPLFGETDVDKILAEAAACRAAHPHNHVRLVGYDTRRQSQGAALVVYRGLAAA
ncbi:ribulose bisphosphate carboxylase small subunit [Methylomagnum ishizawai]|uniref:Ribulose bisphosphate carboxylase small subunit n=1 Tax=Methylomagnum ishizawai TaxID=1760988 RepID=A0A1Y6CV65_9GAMM|nr:ribulose bisphosphate carboxylase small subunit [Methylomagnum ishizawai]BBL74112.1 ribulose bisphosphate carboxylase small subunit [Methylomagnum ishizawai]SMF94549.1 ribulose-bisphosphate carboxylase small chain [Methylomagnum ishizawai]